MAILSVPVHLVWLYNEDLKQFYFSVMPLRNKLEQIAEKVDEICDYLRRGNLCLLAYSVRVFRYKDIHNIVEGGVYLDVDAEREQGISKFRRECRSVIDSSIQDMEQSFFPSEIELSANVFGSRDAISIPV